MFTAHTRLALAFSVASVLAAQSGTPTPGPSFQYSSLTGSGNLITATRVPVTTSSGSVIYQDIVISFDNDGNGNLTVTANYPTINPSPGLLSSSFQAGKYVGPRTVAGGKATVTVSGPGVTTAGGSTTWTSMATSDADPCTYPGSATWYVGPVENNPIYARLKKQNITSTAWSYGVLGGGIAFSCGGQQSFAWGNGAILGVSQVGNTITFATFTNNSFDQASPVDQVTYTLAPSQSTPTPSQ